MNQTTKLRILTTLTIAHNSVKAYTWCAALLFQAFVFVLIKHHLSDIYYLMDGTAKIIFGCFCGLFYLFFVEPVILFALKSAVNLIVNKSIKEAKS